MGMLRFAEQLLGSAIGSASARLVLSLLFERADDIPGDTARLLDEASEALQYNRDLLQTALGQMDQGITVFDNTNRLTVWNKRFRARFSNCPSRSARSDFRWRTSSAILVARGDMRRARSRQHWPLPGDGQTFSLTIGPEKQDHRNPLQPDARQRHCHNLCRHHRAGRRGHGAQAGQ
jgi:hypothetical protein